MIAHLAAYKCPAGLRCDLVCARGYQGFDGKTCRNANVGYCCKSTVGTRLTNKGGSGCSCSKRCGVCTGDCDRNDDCARGLRCFQRNDKRTVPGCVSGGKGDVNGWDYCYAKAPTHTCSCPSGQAGNGPSSP